MAHIKTYCRIKPSVRNFDDYDTTNTTVYIRVPEHLNPVSWGLNVRTKRSVVNHEFKFNGIFNDTASQTDVFNISAKSIVEGFLNGYNGTMFAYGQTGTGKTFTVEGGARTYQDRGIAPRALSMIYSSLASRTDEDIDVHVSYMEIYQEIGYDLLNTAARTSSLVTPFPKVAVVEGAKGSCIIRNLSTHLAANENVAQHLLLQGQANRKVAETVMNQRSSRSHAVFTIYLSAKKQDSDLIVKSKLHLVDLAGSERVSKTGTVGLQLSEAKFINLSLHYLEGVIIALQKEVNNGHTRSIQRPASANTALDYKLYNRWVNTMRSATPTANVSKYVPYRNSLLTMVLRDSLGGNCQTAMIATISMEPENLSESISTCRFAQRVACVTNTLRKNEEIDDKSMIRRLRKKIAELETELAVLRSNHGDELESLDISNMDCKLTDEDKMKCAAIIKDYLGGNLKDPIVAGVTNVQKFRECLRLLKKIVNSHLENNDIAMEVIIGPTSISGPQRSNSIEDIARPINAWGDSGSGSQNTAASNQSPGIQRSLSATTLESETDSNIICVEKPTQVFVTEKENKKNNKKSSKTGVILETHNESMKQARNNMKQNIYGNSKSQKGQGSMYKTADDEFRPDSGSSNRMRPFSSGSEGRRGVSRAVSAPAQFRGRPLTIKSPFERKREIEIKRLDKKVEKTESEIKTQQKHLEHMQNDIKSQQLNILRKEVSVKFDKTSAQLADQYAYIAKLEKTHADNELLEQEKLVEQQLKKRQHKMQKRLQLIDHQLDIIKEEHNSNKDTSKHKGLKEKKEKVPKKKSPQELEIKFSQYLRQNGKVDSKKVMDMLQSKDRKQEKLQDKLEREKMLALTTQVEIKEVATRQKLQEFREKLRQRKELESSSSLFDEDTACESNFSTSVKNNVHSTPVKACPDIPLTKEPNTFIDSQTGDVNFTNSVLSLQSSEYTSSSLTSFGDVQSQQNTNFQVHNESNTHDGEKMTEERPSSGSSAVFLSKWASSNKTNFKSASTSDIEQLRIQSTMMSNKSSTDTSKQWDNAYSSHRHQRTFEIGPAIQLDNIHSNSIEFSNSAIKDLGYEDFPFATSSQHDSQYGDSDNESVSTIREMTPRLSSNKPISNTKSDPFKSSDISQNLFTSDAHRSNTDPFSPGYFSDSFKSNDPNPGKYEAKSSSIRSQGNTGIQNLNKDEISNSTVTSPESVANITDNEKSQMLGGSRTEIKGPKLFYPDHKEIENRDQFENNKYSCTKDANSQGGNNFAHGKRAQSKEPSDFDKALSQMLSMGSSSSTDYRTDISKSVRPEQYNKYARSDKRAYSLTSGKTKMKSQTEESKSKVQLWGPEAKNISVSERLSQYLDMESFDDLRKVKKGKSYEDTDINPYKKPNIADDERKAIGPSDGWKKKQTLGKPQPEIDVDDFHLKIKAMEEEEREVTYMNTARQQRSRIQKIRLAQNAAEVIQKAWRNFRFKTSK